MSDPNIHCYRHLALRDLFVGATPVKVTDHNLEELDALEDIGWVEERIMGKYYLTLSGMVACNVPEVADVLIPTDMPAWFYDL